MYRDFPPNLFRHFSSCSEAVSMKNHFILCGFTGCSSSWRVFLEKTCVFGEGSSKRSSSEEICVTSMVLDGRGQCVGLSVVFI